MKTSSDRLYQLKITLKGIKPPIWRRTLVPADVSLAKLHRILQMVMGWTDTHLHQFTIHGQDYGEPDPDFIGFGNRTKSEKAAKLMNVAGEGDRFEYWYDFGDDWRHEVVVEKIVPVSKGKTYPVCVAGKRACPPEDCGGFWGYEQFLEAIANPEHEEHESMLEWIGGSFDPEAFDLDDTNEGLKRMR